MGWGGGWKFLATEFFFFAKTSSWGLKTQTKTFFFQKCSRGSETPGGGGIWGVWGAPRPHPSVARGRKTIHFFL